MKDWIKFVLGGKLPPERKYVLCLLEPLENKGIPRGVVVGYLRYAAGDKNSPQFITPGIYRIVREGIYCRTREVTHWCYCLSRGFEFPKVGEE